MKMVSAANTLFLILAMAASASAATYTVGDTTGWNIPDSIAFYSTWASPKTFRVGDKLFFNYSTGAHNVMKVSKTEYDACTAVSPLDSYPSGPTTLTLNAKGNHYFLCSVGQHCNFGQKVAIVVSASGSVSPSPAKSVSSPPPASTATPPPSSAPPSSGGPPPATPLSPAASPNQKSSAPTLSTAGLASTTLAIYFAVAYLGLLTS